MTNIQGKRILITGAARGIGLEMARNFADRGGNIILTDIDEEALKAAQAELDSDGKIHTYILDVTDGAAILAVRDRIHHELGPIDVLVNNAGIVFGGPFLEVPIERHALTYAINTLGLVTMTHGFLPDLIASEQGHLVNIASASGLLGLPYGSTYASSKWSVIGFSESIRLELRQQGHKHVHVTTACPSYIDTGLFAGVRAPLLTPILKPAAFADNVAHAIQRNRIFLRTPFMVKIVPLLQGLLPLRVVDWIQSKFGVTASMQFWQGRKSS